MKNVVVKIMICFCLCFVGFSPVTKAGEIEDLQESKKMPVVKNHSFLTEDAIGTQLVVTGLVSFNQEKGVFVITEKTQSRSQVIFMIEKNKKFDKKLELLIDSVITVKGTLQGVFSPWVKSLKITKIL